MVFLYLRAVGVSPTLIYMKPLRLKFHDGKPELRNLGLIITICNPKSSNPTHAFKQLGISGCYITNFIQQNNVAWCISRHLK